MDENEAIREQIQAHIDERKEAGVALAKSVSAIAINNRLLQVTLDPDAAGTTAEAVLEGYDLDFIARFYALPAIGTTDSQTALRERLDRVEVALADGTPVADGRIDVLHQQAMGE